MLGFEWFQSPVGLYIWQNSRFTQHGEHAFNFRLSIYTYSQSESFQKCYQSLLTRLDLAMPLE